MSFLSVSRATTDARKGSTWVKNGKLMPLEASHGRLCSPPSRNVGSPLMSFGKSVHQIFVVARFEFLSELTFCFNSGSFEIKPGVASAPIRYQPLPKVRRQRPFSHAGERA